MGIQINGQTDTVTSTTAGGKVTVTPASFPSVDNLNATGIVTASSFRGNVTGNVNATGLSTFSGGLLVGTGASISSPATNVLTLGTNNSERVRIDSNGNLGIGITNPGGTLHVNGSRILHSLSGINTVEFGYSAGSGDNNVYGLYVPSGRNFYLYGNNTFQLSTTSTGVGIGITNPSAVLHAREQNTTAPSLTWGASCGQIFRNENSEFALGLSNQSPYPLWIQGRTLSSTRRDIVVNPLGGNFGVGVVPWTETTDGLNFKTLVANYQANGSMTTSSWADTTITLTAASNFVFAKIIAVGHENGRNNGFREYFVSWNVYAGWSTNLLVTSNQGNDYGLVDVRMNGSTVQVKAVNNASTGQYRLYVTHYLT